MPVVGLAVHASTLGGINRHLGSPGVVTGASVLRGAIRGQREDQRAFRTNHPAAIRGVHAPGIARPPWCSRPLVNVREAGTVAGEQQVVQGGLPVRNERVQALNVVLTQLRGLREPERSEPCAPSYRPQRYRSRSNRPERPRPSGWGRAQLVVVASGEGSDGGGRSRALRSKVR